MLFQVLGVERNASQREIQKAFHKYVFSIILFLLSYNAQPLIILWFCTTISHFLLHIACHSFYAKHQVIVLCFGTDFFKLISENVGLDGCAVVNLIKLKMHLYAQTLLLLLLIKLKMISQSIHSHKPKAILKKKLNPMPFPYQKHPKTLSVCLWQLS